MYLFSHLRKFDWYILGASLGLTAFGLASLYSTTLGGAGDAGLFWRQLVFSGLGLSVVFVLSFFNYRQLSGAARPLYVLALALLVAVLLFGSTIRGTRGWFSVFGLGLQPVELVKIILVVYLARFMSDYARDPVGLRRIVGSGLALAGVFTLVLLQPDLGSATLLLIVWGAMLLISGIRRRHLLIMAGLGLTVVACAWLFLLSPYQKDRVNTFLNPASDPLGSGYNVTQSVIAIGSGGLVGKGLGFGSQSQLRFLPERQTDFIFAVIAEELGFLGVLVVLALFALIFWRAYVLAVHSRSDFATFLVLGLSVSLAAEMFVNVGADLQLMPVTGVTLPFVSYGGSSLLAKFTMIGLLESIAVRRS
jgi:rod shape determining protein RodA